MNLLETFIAITLIALIFASLSKEISNIYKLLSINSKSYTNHLDLVNSYPNSNQCNFALSLPPYKIINCNDQFLFIIK